MSKLTQAARGQDCQIRLPDICLGSPETVVACHGSKGSLTGKGIGSKCSDLFIAFGCQACHDVYDRRVRVNHLARLEIEHAFYEGVIRTQLILLGQGLIKI